jgi:WD40 repeat protein
MQRRFLLLALLTQVTLAHADPKPALRLLRDECLGCHKPGKAKGGLLLTTPEKVLTGGDSGPAILPGKADQSLLYQVLLPDADDHMPPKKQLSDSAIAAIHSWINTGAKWDPSVFDEPPAISPITLRKLPDTYAPALSLALSTDGNRLAVGKGSEVLIHDLTQPERPLLHRLSVPHSTPLSLAWTPDHKRLIVGSFRHIAVWDADSGTLLQHLDSGLIGMITCIALSPDGSSLFAADGETGGLGFIHRLKLADLSLQQSWKAHDDNITSLALSHDGKLLASAGADKIARTWRPADGKPISFYEGHTNHIVALAFNHDASQMATAGADREIKVWDVKNREQDAILGDKKTPFTALAWTADGKSLTAINEKGAASVYTELQKHSGAQRSDAAKERKLDPAATMLVSVAISPDSKTVYAGAFNGTVHIWDATTGKTLGTLAQD